MNTRMRGPNASRGHSVLPVARELTERTFRQRDIPGVRRVAAVFGTRAGMGPGQLRDFVQAVSEAAACAVAQGPCTARVRLWTMGSRVFCEMSGDGTLRAGGPPGGPQRDEERLRRWLLPRLCDHASVMSGPQGVTVVLSMKVG
jgi:hypothetical protein